MKHLQVLRYANFALGAYTFVIGTLFLILFGVPGWMAQSDGEAFGWLFVVIGIVSFLAIGALAVAHLVAGYLVGAQRGRSLQGALAVLQLLSFPVGTFYALYAVWVCWVNRDSSRAFDATIKPMVS